MSRPFSFFGGPACVFCFVLFDFAVSSCFVAGVVSYRLISFCLVCVLFRWFVGSCAFAARAEHRPSVTSLWGARPCRHSYRPGSQRRR